jgi:hypothetical protein
VAVKLDKDTYLEYSPEEDFYFIEIRDPQNWRISEQAWKTAQEAIEAHRIGSVEFVSIEETGDLS